MQVYKSRFANAYFDEDKSLFTVVWSDSKQKMTENIFKKTIIEYIKILKEIKPRLFLFDSRTIVFPIEPELQKWINKNSLLQTKEIIEKEAILIKKDIFMYLSAEQTIEIEKDFVSERMIFYDKDVALEWLFEK